MNPFGWATACIPLLFTFLAWSGGEWAALIVFVGFNLLLNLPHQYATWRRVVAEHRLDRRLLVPALLVVGMGMVIACCPLSVQAVILGDVFLYWGIHHLAGQNLGITRMLGATRGCRWHDRIFHAGWAVFLIGWLHLMTPMSYQILDNDISLGHLPLTRDLRLVLGCVLVLLGVGLPLWRLMRWRAAPAALASFEIGVLLSTIAALAAPSLLVSVAGLTAVHNFHYLGLVRGQQAGWGRPLRWTDGVLAAVYAGVIASIYVTLPALGPLLFAMLVALHYLVDARIWHPARDSRLAHSLTSLRVAT